MKITKLNVKTYRNFKNIDVEFWDLNIITWKNSSWKSNFLTLMENMFSTNKDLSPFYNTNIVTYWPWYRSTTIDVEVVTDWRIWLKNDNKTIKYYEPKKFKFYNTIDKFCNSLQYRIDYLWIISEINDWDWWKKKIINNGEDWIKDAYVSQDEKKDSDINIWNEYYQIFTFFVKRWLHKNQFDDLQNKNILTWYWIYEFITKNTTLEIENEVKEYLNNDKKEKINFLWREFFTMPFLFLLAEIQKEKKILYKRFLQDLHYFTDGIVKSLEIVEKWAEWTKWTIQIQTPSWPKDLRFISTGTAVIIYLVTLHHWILLRKKSPFQMWIPWYICFDELDSVIHPSLLSKISELLQMIWKNVQLFISTHSPYFIDQFEKNDVYYLKDIWSIPKSFNTQSNILSYKSILEWLSDDTKQIFLNKQNSELFVEWYIDDLFLNISKNG